MLLDVRLGLINPYCVEITTQVVKNQKWYCHVEFPASNSEFAA